MTPTGSEPGADFDRWLRRQLRAALDPELGPRPHPEEARYTAASRQTGGRATPFRLSVTAAFGAKALIGGAVVALAAGAAAGTVTTGSANPASWGQHIAEAVEQCRKADVDVGRCVSAIAQEHGEQVRAQHSEADENATASPGPKPGQREGQATGQSSKGATTAAAPDGRGQAHDTTSAASPAPARADHGHGRPSPSPGE